MASPLRIEHEPDGLDVVTIAAPPLNLFDTVMREALRATVDELERSSPRAVLFRAEGKVVTGGVDVRVFDAIETPDAAAELFADLVDLARRVDTLPCPTVFAAHALCLTWAFELALACDLIVAAESASFGLVEAGVGLTPAMGGTQRLAERAGTARAAELVFTAERFEADTLQRWNVVNRVLPDEGFDAATREFAGRLAAGPTRAHSATKDVLQAFVQGGVPTANDAVPAIAGGLFDTEDLRNALRTFLAEGPGRATFRGR